MKTKNLPVGFDKMAVIGAMLVEELRGAVNT